MSLKSLLGKVTACLCHVLYVSLSWTFQIPADVASALEPIKDDDKAVTAFGIHLGTEMCKKILAHGIKNLHIYTLNLDKSAVGILQVSLSEYVLCIMRFLNDYICFQYISPWLSIYYYFSFFGWGHCFRILGL